MRLRYIVLAVLALIVLPFTGARAAPQILALITTDEPVPLDCRDGECTAMLTAICLQKDRVPPPPETAYEPIGLENNLKLVAATADGAVRELPAKGEVAIVSHRNFLSVRVSVPEEALARLGATGLAISVGQGVSLLPAPVPNDATPQSAQDIAYATTTLRGEAAWIDDPANPNSSRARIANRVLSLLPASGPVEKAEARRAYERVASAHAGAPGMAEFGKLYTYCETMSGWSVHGRNMRECVESWHDSLMMEENVEYWRRTGAGS